MLNVYKIKSIMDEAVLTTGKEIDSYIPPELENQLIRAFVKSGEFESEDDVRAMLNSSDGIVSILSSDVYGSLVNKELEKYDKNSDELVLHSKNLVEAYNNMINAKFDEALKSLKEKAGELDLEAEIKPLLNGIESMAMNFNAFEEHFGSEINLEEMKKTIISSSFITSDNPDVIKSTIRLRMNYNQNMIKLFQNMLKTNYQLLGIDKDKALIMSERLSSPDQDTRQNTIKELKVKVLENKSKFDNGKFIDFRSIGGGVIFVTKKFTGLDNFISIDRMLQLSLKYDCIIVAHGTEAPKGKTVEDIEDINKGNVKYTEEWEDKSKYRWIVQPVFTENAGPFHDVNDLIRQCIKEGHKKIMVMSCNPGHHTIDPDIKKTKGILITYSKDSLMAENATTDQYYSDVEYDNLIDENFFICNTIEEHLISICNECGIHYNDDTYLNDCYNDLENNYSTLTEGTAGNIWSKIKELIKKVIGGLVSLFKKMIDMIKSLITKIKDAIQNLLQKRKLGTKLSKPIKISYIMLENASVKDTSISSWNDIEKTVLNSCTKISEKVQKLEHDQLDCMKKMQEFAEKKDREALHENSIAYLRNFLRVERE